ncbi:uncharacterized protein LOC115891466 [Sitophilus oryzae]|uniref:Uncharacterized protein LOC115891466 n=1 Tax=Sitophilus oryzae TaxID=7048 RepID=A0A6J2YY81_SITOR|nr:uncharacterized protein LOC115891466 [Sitophilus oryzae]
MVVRRTFFISCWIYVAQCSTFSFRKVQFLPATSFTRREDHFISSSKFVPSHNFEDFGSSHNFGSSDFSNYKPSGFGIWNSNQENSFSSFKFESNAVHHITPDFSDGLSYPDPLLLTGQRAKNAASYLYKKELFFHEIPHVNSLLQYQDVRKRNGLVPVKLGSLRLASPWNRFKEHLSNHFYV